MLKRERGALLETPDLLLAKASPADWRGLYRNVWSHAETARYMLWSVTTSAAEARARLTRTLAWQQTHEAFTVYLRKTGEAIGFAGFRFVGAETAEDTGVALGPAFVRKGYGTQIVRALCARAKALGAKTMILSAREQNAASRGLIESLGFRRTETEPRTDERDGSAYRLIFYRRTL
ncbi:MAG: GNAT family N-acetyltransferase [Oscillospiraceae bacterium]|nr:GNAT family N-acetyltransferase [Oscillospiraceae bacterium]